MRAKESKLDRILLALSHPLRRRILRELVKRQASASILAREFEISLGVVSYHLNRVLAKRCDALELVETIPRRGSIEKVYRLKTELWADLPKDSELVKGEQGALRALTPAECFLEAAEALDEETFGQLEGSAWEWFPILVDSEAWEAIQQARQDFKKRIEDAAGKAQAREEGKRAELRAVVVGAAAFPAAKSETTS